MLPATATAASTGGNGYRIPRYDSDGFAASGAESLAGLAAVLVLEGQIEWSAELIGAAKAAGYPGPDPDPDDQAMLDRLERDYFDAARARLGSSVWNQLTHVGEDFSFDQAIAFALAEAGDLDQGFGVA